MTSQRIAFLDVDGTVIDSGELIAQSTIDAVRGARANGHLVYPSTGRAFVENYHSIDAQSSSDFGSMFAMSVVSGATIRGIPRRPALPAQRIPHHRDQAIEIEK